MRYRDYLIKTSESSWPRVLDRVTPYTTLGSRIRNAIRTNKRSKKKGRTVFKRALDVLKGDAKGSSHGFLAGQALYPAQVFTSDWLTNNGGDVLGSNTAVELVTDDTWLLPTMAIHHSLEGANNVSWL